MASDLRKRLKSRSSGSSRSYFYSRAFNADKGLSFGTYLDQLAWPQTELFLHLKKRSAFINITLEDVARITDTFETLYSIDEDPQAVPPPADRSLIGR